MTGARATGAKATGERRVYVRALVGISIAIVVIAIVGVAVAWARSGAAAAGAAAVGAAVGAIAGLATPASMLLGREKPAATLGAVVAGIWLGKMILIVAVIAVVSRIDGFAKLPFALTLLASVLASLAVDVWAVVAGRVPYVEPGSKSRA